LVIGVSTLLRWLQNPEFVAAYREARRVAFSQATARLQQAASAAATTFLKLMVDPSVPAAVRLRAADLVISHGAKAIEIEDIDARVSLLEAAIESKEGGTKQPGSWKRLG
jgi:hypothetical protein